MQNGSSAMRQRPPGPLPERAIVDRGPMRIDCIVHILCVTHERQELQWTHRQPVFKQRQSAANTHLMETSGPSTPACAAPSKADRLPLAAWSPLVRSYQPTRFGLLLARYRVQLTLGLVSLALALILCPDTVQDGARRAPVAGKDRTRRGLPNVPEMALPRQASALVDVCL